MYKYNGKVKAIAIKKVKGIRIHQYFIFNLIAIGPAKMDWLVPVWAVLQGFISDLAVYLDSV